MKITDAILQALRTTVRAEFAKTMAGFTASDYLKVSSLVPSTSASNTYDFLLDFPQIKEWLNKRAIESIKESSYQIENKSYESTLGVKRANIEDDNLGTLRLRVQAEAAAVESFKNNGIFSLLKNGFATLCFDGQNFFDTDHPVNAKRDGSGSSSTTSNIVGDKTKKDDPWFLLATKYPLKPLIFQQRTPPTMESFLTSNSDHVFMTDQFLFGIRLRGNFAYGFWQQAVASKEPLTLDNFNLARKTMMEFKRDGGDPMGIKPDMLVVPASLEATARELTLAEKSANGSSNINYKIVDVLSTPWL